MHNVKNTRLNGGIGFQTTQWGMVLTACQSYTPEATQQALAGFCQAYWAPLYAFLSHRGYSSIDAQDLTQGFFAHLLEQNLLSRVDRNKGRLRTFLLRALENYLANEYDRRQALKRGGGREIIPLHEHLLEAEAAFATTSLFDESACYDRAWVSMLINRAWRQLQQEYDTAGKAHLLEHLAPLLLGGTTPLPRPEEVAERLNLPHATLRTSLLTLRRRYRELLRTEIAHTVADPTQIEEEMRYLFHLLSSHVCSLPMN